MALGSFVPDLGSIGAAKHRVIFDTLAKLDLQQWPASSPWAPYFIEPVFYLLNHFGLRLFSLWQMPDSLTAFVHEDRATLLSVSGFGIFTTPLQQRLLSGLEIAERPQMEVVLQNRDGYWERLTEQEALLAMPAGVYVFVRREGLVPLLVGTLGAWEFAESVVTLRIGDFTREEEQERGS